MQCWSILRSYFNLGLVVHVYNDPFLLMSGREGGRECARDYMNDMKVGGMGYMELDRTWATIVSR